VGQLLNPALVGFVAAHSGYDPVVKQRCQRQSTLATQIATLTAQGRRIESQSDYQVVLLKGHYLWETREIVLVDEWGNVSVQRLGFEKEKLMIALGVVALFLILLILALLN
jgi:hypothetical protein